MNSAADCLTLALSKRHFNNFPLHEVVGMGREEGKGGNGLKDLRSG